MFVCLFVSYFDRFPSGTRQLSTFTNSHVRLAKYMTAVLMSLSIRSVLPPLLLINNGRMSTIDLQTLCSWALDHQTFNEQLIAFTACILIIQAQLELIFEMVANDE